MARTETPMTTGTTHFLLAVAFLSSASASTIAWLLLSTARLVAALIDCLSAFEVNFWERMFKPALIAAWIFSFVPISAIAWPALLLSVGLNSVLINDFKRILASGDYWISIEVDSVYSASYSVGVNEISAQSSSLLSGNVYNGSTWSSTPSYGLKYAINGHSYNLQLKVQSSASNKKLKAIGVLFNEELSGPVDSNNYRQVFVFYGSENKVNFHLTKFIPDADKLKVYDANSGQVYVYPAFSVDGRTVTFPSGTFQTLTAELITLRFEQVEGSVFDNSDTNANLLATNHLGSNDPTIDKSIAGRGIILRRPDGTLRELIITNSDTVSIIPVV